MRCQYREWEPWAKVTKCCYWNEGACGQRFVRAAHLQDVQHARHLGEDERFVVTGLQPPQQLCQFLNNTHILL